MAAGDIKIAWAASSNMTVTALDGLSESATYTDGWESPIIDNSSTLYDDIFVSAKFTVGDASVLLNGQIRIYVIGMLDDLTWPLPFDGTAGTVTVDASVIRNHGKLGAVVTVDDVENKVYYAGPFSIASLFGGVCPAKCLLFITQNTNDELAAAPAGVNQVTTKGCHHTVAQA